MGPVRRAERVADEAVAEARERPGERQVALRLAGVEAHVLAEHGRPLGRLLDRRLDLRADRLVELQNRTAEQLLEALIRVAVDVSKRVSALAPLQS